jgi:hypothetical protein
MKITALTLAAIVGLGMIAKADPFTMDTYNNSLPFWGTSWKPGRRNAVDLYYPSFDTGFAPSQEMPERTHIQTSRGNQTRVTVILDDQPLTDCLFDLVTLDEFDSKVIDNRPGQSLVTIQKPS